MAAAFIDLNRETELGRMKARGLQMIREGRQLLAQARAIEIQMRDGDGTQDAHYTLNATEQGVQPAGYASAAAAARASFNECDSLIVKLTQPSGQGDSTGAAIDQACAKHGV